MKLSKRLLAVGEIRQLNTRIGKDGKRYKTPLREIARHTGIPFETVRCQHVKVTVQDHLNRYLAGSGQMKSSKRPLPGVEMPALLVQADRLAYRIIARYRSISRRHHSRACSRSARRSASPRRRQPRAAAHIARRRQGWTGSEAGTKTGGTPTTVGSAGPAPRSRAS